jgi:outer membrane protein assembly factor BamE (lipoprotein component of BamABCDE complex)
MGKNILFAIIVLLLAGCTMGKRQVNSLDLRNIQGKLVIGVTTEQQLLEILGPPSLVDMRTMNGRTIYYYWAEKLRNKSLYLGVYNYWNVDIQYERAMFVFDNQKGVLENYGISKEKQD